MKTSLTGTVLSSRIAFYCKRRSIVLSSSRQDQHPEAARPWDGTIPADEQRLYRLGGFGKDAAINGRPALLVVDVQYRMTGTKALPMSEAVLEFPTSCGAAAWQVMPVIAFLIEAFRKNNFPIIYVALGPKTSFKRESAPAKAVEYTGLAPNHPDFASSEYDIVKDVEPRPQDVIVWKYGPSAFFGTPVASLLRDQGIQTVVIAGSSTSGCVRATAVDAFSYRFDVVVPQDAVFDRGPTSHAVSLFDMSTRYATVTSAEQVVAQLSNCQRV